MGSYIGNHEAANCVDKILFGGKNPESESESEYEKEIYIRLLKDIKELRVEGDEEGIYDLVRKFIIEHKGGNKLEEDELNKMVNDIVNELLGTDEKILREIGARGDRDDNR